MVGWQHMARLEDRELNKPAALKAPDPEDYSAYLSILMTIT